MRRFPAVIAVFLLLGGGLVSALPASSQADPASRAVRYLASQIGPDGSVAGSPGATEDAVMGTAAAGFDPSTVTASTGRGYFDFLRLQTAGLATLGPGATAKLILAVLAGRKDPTAFPSSGSNLVDHLESLYNSGSGAYGTPPSLFDQALSVIAVKAAAPSFNQSKAPVYLAGLEDSDGGWAFTGVKNDPAGSDSNSTAIALMALDYFGDHSHDGSASTAGSALGYLKSTQASDGGFQYQAAFGSDPDSDALVLQALVAAGQSPYSAAWLIAGRDAYSNLLSFQDPSSGGFNFPGNAAPDAFTTSQVPAGLELQPFPVITQFPTANTIAAATNASVAAVRYLASQEGGDGSIAGATGPTEDWVIGVAASGYDPSTLVNCSSRASAYGYLGTQVTSGLAAMGAGATAKLILAVLAGRKDPTAFPSSGSNLVDHLESLYNSGSGAYGTPPSLFDQALSVIAVKAAAPSFNQSKAPVYLAGLEDSDGGWAFTGVKNDPAGSDSNSTAIALMALDYFGDHSHDGSASTAGSALGYLKSTQASDGGFQYQAAFGSDPDSDALVLQALVGATQDPVSAAWSQGSKTVISNLPSFQASNGGFTFPGNGGPDAFTTSQIPAGLERLAFPIVGTFPAGAQVPGTACSSPSPTPAPIATPTPAPVSSPAPTPAPAAGPTAAPAAPPASPAPAAVVVPSPSPVQSPAPSPTQAAQAGGPNPPARAAAQPVAGSRPEPPLLVYVLAAAIGLVAVVAGGALYFVIRR